MSEPAAEPMDQESGVAQTTESQPEILTFEGMLFISFGESELTTTSN